MLKHRFALCVTLGFALLLAPGFSTTPVGAADAMPLRAIGGPGVPPGGPEGEPFDYPFSYVAYRSDKPIKIDGVLDEEDWSKAPVIDAFMDIRGPDHPTQPWKKIQARMLWDDDYLYIAAELEEDHIWATVKNRDETIYHDNDFEVFIDPNSDNHEYYEFEMNAFNTQWELFMEKPYRDGGPYNTQWDADGLKTAVHIDGTINDPSDEDKMWSIEIAYPWRGLATYAYRPCPPQNGDQWRIGFSRVQWHTEVVDGKYQKVPGKPEENWTWPWTGEVQMHKPEKWAYVQFSTEPAGTDRFRPDPTVAAREILMEVYHAQRRHHARHNRITFIPTDLDTTVTHPSFARPLDIRRRAHGGYRATATVQLPDGWTQQVHIIEDSRMWADWPMKGKFFEPFVAPEER